MSVKLVVSGSSKESRIALVGRTGKELLTSATFTEPRAKGATLRALKKIFGSEVVVEDSTTTTAAAATSTTGRPAIVAPGAKDASGATAALATPVPKQTAAIGRSRRQATASAAKKQSARKTTKRSAKPGPAE